MDDSHLTWVPDEGSSWEFILLKEVAWKKKKNRIHAPSYDAILTTMQRTPSSEADLPTREEIIDWIWWRTNEPTPVNLRGRRSSVSGTQPASGRPSISIQVVVNGEGGDRHVVSEVNDLADSLAKLGLKVTK